MKNILFISLLALSALIKAQDSAFCYSGGLVAVLSEDVSFPAANNKQTQSLILMPYVMNQKEVLGFLKEKKNSRIEKLLTKVKVSKNLRLVGLAAIPAGIVGALSISDANKNHSSQSAGIGLISLGFLSLGSSFYFDHQRKENYKKAIAKYNQLYN